MAPARKKNLILEFRNESIDFVNVASAGVCGKTRDDERDEKSIVCTFFLFLSDWSYRLPRINHSYFFIGLLLLHTYLQSSQRGSFDCTLVLCTIYLYSTMLLNILLAFFCSLNSYNIFLSKRTFSFF